VRFFFRLNHYDLCRSYHSQHRMFCLHVFYLTGEPRRADCLASKWENGIKCLSLGHSDELPYRESFQGVEDRGVEKLHGDPTVGPHPAGPEVKNGSTGPTSRRLNVVMRFPPLFSRGGPKWRDNYPEGPGHPVAHNRLEPRYRCFATF